MAKLRKIAPVHPGEILREDFLLPLGISMNKLALGLRVPVTRISEIVHERRSITVDSAIRLGVYFGTTPEFWMNLQRDYDLRTAQEKSVEIIKREVTPFAEIGRRLTAQ
jgi:addiction module HigA family antidote